eukprot:14637807-Alexandrium_andersonii.AAC.1
MRTTGSTSTKVARRAVWPWRSRAWAAVSYCTPRLMWIATFQVASGVASCASRAASEPLWRKGVLPSQGSSPSLAPL